MSKRRGRTYALWGLLVFMLAVGAVNLQCYRDRGSIYTPVFLSVEDVIVRYRCEYGRWPKTSEEVWLYIDRDYFDYVYESQRKADFRFALGSSSMNSLEIKYTGRSPYFGIGYEIPRRIVLTEVKCKEVEDSWTVGSLEQIRRRNESLMSRRDSM